VSGSHAATGTAQQPTDSMVMLQQGGGVGEGKGYSVSDVTAVQRLCIGLL
jgi:hypothetical protein